MQIEKFNEKKLQKEIEEFEKGSKKLFISTDDTTVCWRIWGKGQPIIFLHGGYGSWRHWIKQVIYLSKDYQILVPDMPGFGESSDLKSDHTPENISLNLYQTFRKLNITDLDNINLVGFSFGGLISGHLSYQFLKKGIELKNLILVGPGGTGSRRGPMREMVRRTPKMSFEEILRAHFENLKILMINNPKNIDLLSLYIQLENTNNHRLKSRPISATNTLIKILEKQNIIPYLIFGEKDATVGPYLEERISLFREACKDVRIHVEIDAGHWIMYEKPDRFNNLIKEIIN
jgi:2-hydroxy-6-oxonona-2,4-dienedioate hydrolase